MKQILAWSFLDITIFFALVFLVYAIAFRVGHNRGYSKALTEFTAEMNQMRRSSDSLDVIQKGQIITLDSLIVSEHSNIIE